MKGRGKNIQDGNQAQMVFFFFLRGGGLSEGTQEDVQEQCQEDEEKKG